MVQVDPTIIQTMFQHKLPVWHLRVPAQLCDRFVLCAIAPSTAIEQCPSVPVTLFASMPAYTGYAGEKVINAIWGQARKPADIEHTPRNPIPSSLSGSLSAPVQPSSPGPSLNRPRDALVPSDKNPHRYQPCMSVWFTKIVQSLISF